MIGYVTLGTNDIARAGALLRRPARGARRASAPWRWRPSSPGPRRPAGRCCRVIKPYDKKPATVGNGVMVALAAKSKAQVDAIHRKALELGAKDEGAPGPRGDGFYAGYFRDLDGNKLNAFFIG